MKLLKKIGLTLLLTTTVCLAELPQKWAFGNGDGIELLNSWNIKDQMYPDDYSLGRYYENSVAVGVEIEDHSGENIVLPRDFSTESLLLGKLGDLVIRRKFSNDLVYDTTELPGIKITLNDDINLSAKYVDYGAVAQEVIDFKAANPAATPEQIAAVVVADKDIPKENGISVSKQGSELIISVDLQKIVSENNGSGNLNSIDIQDDVLDGVNTYTYKSITILPNMEPVYTFDPAEWELGKGDGSAAKVAITNGDGISTTNGDKLQINLADGYTNWGADKVVMDAKIPTAEWKEKLGDTENLRIYLQVKYKGKHEYWDGSLVNLRGYYGNLQLFIPDMEEEEKWKYVQQFELNTPWEYTGREPNIPVYDTTTKWWTSTYALDLPQFFADFLNTYDDQKLRFVLSVKERVDVEFQSISFESTILKPQFAEKQEVYEHVADRHYGGFNSDGSEYIRFNKINDIYGLRTEDKTILSAADLHNIVERSNWLSDDEKPFTVTNVELHSSSRTVTKVGSNYEITGVNTLTHGFWIWLTVDVDNSSDDITRGHQLRAGNSVGYGVSIEESEIRTAASLPASAVIKEITGERNVKSGTAYDFTVFSLEPMELTVITSDDNETDITVPIRYNNTLTFPELFSDIQEIDVYFSNLRGTGFNTIVYKDYKLVSDTTKIKRLYFATRENVKLDMYLTKFWSCLPSYSPSATISYTDNNGSFVVSETQETFFGTDVITEEQKNVVREWRAAELWKQCWQLIYVEDL